MSKKVLSVTDALKSIEGKTNSKGEIVLNRFSKKNFNTLLLALANDSTFTAKVAKKTKEGTCEIQELLVTKDFRKWCRDLVVSAGMDTVDADKILSDNFIISNVDGLYEFFTAAVYEYMSAGNKFDLLPTEDFNATLSIKEIGDTSKTTAARNPITGESLGNVTTKKKKHKEMKVKSNCPDWLVTKIKG